MRELMRFLPLMTGLRASNRDCSMIEMVRNHALLYSRRCSKTGDEDRAEIVGTGSSDGPQRRLGQDEGSRARGGEGDFPLALGSRPLDGDDPADAVLGMKDRDAGPEGVEVDRAGGRQRAAQLGGGGQVEAAAGGRRAVGGSA